MKKSFAIIALAALVMLAGCKKNDPKPNGTRLIAGIEKHKSDSKTSLDGLQIKWSEGDKLYVNNGTTPATFTLVSGAGTTTGEFATTDEYTFAAENNVAVYPNTCVNGLDNTTVTMTLLAVQTATAAGSFGNGANPMLGTFSDMDNLTLTSLCGVLCLQLTGNAHITAIEIVGGPDDKLNGTFTVDYMNPVLTYSANGTNSVRLNCEATLTPTAQKFYVVVPAGTLHGLTMKVYNGDNVIFSKSTANEVPVFVNTLSTMVPVEVVPFNPLATPLTIEAKEAGATVRLSLPSQAGATMEYSTDGTNWSSYASNTDITLANAGDKVMFRAPVSGNTRLGYQQNIGYGVYVVNGSRFYISNKDCYVYGNVMSLLYQDFFDKTSFPEGSQYTMPSLFTGCDRLYNHPDKAIILPATTLALSCYESMFNNCTNLTTIPELPATTLVKSCYKSMFNNCTSLTSIPSDLLPSTDLAESCYQSMFNGCSGLTTIPGDLLPATTLKNNCYQNMFTHCTGLTSIPENLLQSVTTLANYCYASMFSSCSGLTSVPDDLLPITTLAPYCYQYMFTNCTGLTTAPDLPAAELVSSCYYYMFQNCSNLHSIKCLATSGINENQSTYNWVFGVASTGTFYADLDATWPTGQNGIPTGWNVVTIPEGALKGKFTINVSGDQVYFSKGNLQYIGSAGNGVASEGNPGAYWKFAEHQWETLGNNGQTSTAVAQDRDLFAWGSSGYNHNNNAYQPWHHRPSEYGAFYAYGGWSNALYSSTGMADWGYNAIQNGGNTENSGWRTMKNSEYAYILSTRTTSSGIRYAKASIDGYNGVILLPDDWDAGYYILNNYNTENANFNTNSISMSDWISQLELHGAVFLPAAGQRHAANTNSITIQNYNSQGRYWLSETNGSSYKYQCRNHLISDQYCRLNGQDRREGLAVRLVRNVE